MRSWHILIIMAVLTTTIASALITDGVICAYTFDGSVVRDNITNVSATAYNSVQSSTLWDRGREYNGSTAAGDTFDTNSFCAQSAGTDYTISYRVKPYSLGSTEFHFYDRPNALAGSWAVNHAAGGSITFRLWKSTASTIYYVSSTLTLSSNIWNNVTIQYDYSEDTINYTINGVSQVRSASTGSGSNYHSSIGGTSTTSMDGEIDDLVVWNRLLTSAELARAQSAAAYPFPNTPPSDPTGISFNTPLFVLSTATATPSGSTDPDGDSVTYQCRFYDESNSTILHDWGSCSYVIPVTAAHDIINVTARAYDGANYSQGNISDTFTVGNSLVTLTGILPADNAHLRNLTTTAVAWDADDDTLTCNLTIEGTNYGEYSPVVSGGNVTVSIHQALPDGSYEWSLTCDDNQGSGYTSTTRTAVVDTLNPLPDMLRPLLDNSTVVGGSFMMTGNVSDLYLYKVNMTLYYPNSTVMYNDYSGVIDQETYDLSAWINMSGRPYGTYSGLLEATDDHTLGELRGMRAIIDDGLIFESDDGYSFMAQVIPGQHGIIHYDMREVMLSEKLPPGLVKRDYLTEYKWGFWTVAGAGGISQADVRIYANTPISIRNPAIGHLVIGETYTDFISALTINAGGIIIPATLDVTRVDDYEVIVHISFERQPAGTKITIDPLTGGLNTISVPFTFEYQQSPIYLNLPLNNSLFSSTTTSAPVPMEYNTTSEVCYVHIDGTLRYTDHDVNGSVSHTPTVTGLGVENHTLNVTCGNKMEWVSFMTNLSYDINWTYPANGTIVNVSHTGLLNLTFWLNQPGVCRLSYASYTSSAYSAEQGTSSNMTVRLINGTRPHTLTCGGQSVIYNLTVCRQAWECSAYDICFEGWHDCLNVTASNDCGFAAPLNLSYLGEACSAGETLHTASCPSTTPAMMGLIAALMAALGMVLFGVAQKSFYIGIFGSVLLLPVGWVFTGCHPLIGISFSVCGAVGLILFPATMGRIV